MTPDSKSSFIPVKSDVNFPQLEEKTLQFWDDEKIFEKSMNDRAHAEPFSFYDGPPFATGLPHYGHLLAGTLKDIVPRFWTMKGHRVQRRFGWDCHGVPVEFEINKTLTEAQQIKIRQNKYLNNMVEQDHRFIKKITRPMLGFKSIHSARATLDGIELHHMLRKNQHVNAVKQSILSNFILWRPSCAQGVYTC